MSEFSFSCPACGQSVSCDTAQAGNDVCCPACQALIVVPNETVESPADSPQTATPPPWTGYIAAPAAPRFSRLAIASLVCSLASLVTCVGWLPGIICGHLAKSRIRRNPALKGNGLATAGLAIGYLILMLETGIAAVRISSFTSALKQGYEHARQELHTNSIIVTQPQPVTASNVNPPEAPTASGWTSDFSQMSFPDHPASGQLHGNDFALKTASFRAASLKLSSADGLSLEILGLRGPIEGRNLEIQPALEVQPAGESANPRVRMTWNEEGVVQTATFSQGYRLKLELGQAVKRKVSGKIYVCLPDDAKSCVAGTFELRVPKPK